MKRVFSFTTVAFILVLAFSVSAFSAKGSGISQKSPATRTVVYIYPPASEYARKWDPLVATTVLRLIEINLAASDSAFPVFSINNPKEKSYPYITITGEYPGNKKNVTGEHKISVLLAKEPGNEKVIASRNVSWKSFGEMTQCINSLCDNALKKLSSNLNLHLQENLKNSPNTAENKAALEKARDQSLLVHSGKIYQASKYIDKVLYANPLSAEAHYDAALCVTMLGYQDIYGRFHDRSRYLAKPLAHLLFAEMLSEPKSLDDNLTHCWTAYLCGYPTAANEILNSFSDADKKSPEALALKMFITSNFTLLPKNACIDATPMQQLAWMYAVQDCAVTTELDNIPYKLCNKSKTCAFFTTYSRSSVGLEHGYSVSGVNFAIARDADDLLCNECLPLEKRQAVAEKLAGILNISSQGDVKALSKRIGNTLRKNSRQINFTGAIQPMMKLYGDAIEVSQQDSQSPVTNYKWQSISLRDFAELQRSIFLMRLNRRLCFMAYSWCVRGAAAKLSDNIAKNISKSMPDMSKYFKGFAICLTDEKERQKKLANEILDSPLGELDTTKFTIAGNWSGRMQKRMDLRFIPGRGCWQWRQLVFWSRNSYKHMDLYWVSVYMLVASDSYSTVPLNGLIWKTKKFDCLDTEEMKERAQYDMRMLKNVSSFAKCIKNYKAAEKYSKLAVDSPYATVGTYYRLVDLYTKMGEKDKAINTALEAVNKFDYSVGMSNLQGKLAVLLVEKGRNKEALKWGKKAARSYSCMGLNGLAVALEANGELESAYDVFKANALRYISGIYKCLDFMMRNNYPTNEIVDDISEFCKAYPNNKNRVGKTVFECIRKKPEYYDVLEKAYKGPLSYINKKEQKKNLEIIKADRKWALKQGEKFTIDAKKNEKSPIATGITIKKGEKFFILPHPKDTWCGGGHMQGHPNNYEGFKKNEALMKMYYKIKDSKQPVTLEPQTAAADGELLIYCEDYNPGDNSGRIRVKVQIITEDTPEKP